MTQVRTMPLVDLAILKSYYNAGPRYTAYPSADRFVEAFGPQDHASWLRKRGIGGFNRNLGLYVHIASSDSACPLCGRYEAVTLDREAFSRYLDYLQKELRLQSSFLDERAIVHLRWGGDTTTLLRVGGLASLSKFLDTQFERSAKTGHSIELDPLALDEDRVADLIDAGVNQLRVSIGGCEAGRHDRIDRAELIDATEVLVGSARSRGVSSVSIGVVFGEPGQTVMAFNQTMKQILALSPERLTLHDYAHPPNAARSLRKASETGVLAEPARMQMFAIAVMRLAEAGYVHIGMDQFARPDDELAVAQRQGRLHRNLQGFCAHADCDLLGLGVGAMSQMGPAYSQNARSLEDYYGMLDEDSAPVSRGIELTADDLARRTVMDALMCHLQVAFESVEIAHLLDFRSYFADELEELKQLADAGLVTLDEGWLSVTEKGRYVVWTICQVFDRYLRQGRRRASFEKVL